jgi:p-hydroxybenzoate 3-monooxygenase
VTIYAQQEVVKDLVAARLAAGQEIFFEVTDVAVHDLLGDAPRVTFTDASGRPREIHCAVVAACDGSHSTCRAGVPAGRLRTLQREYPFGWLGILARRAPSSHELVYAWHRDGFALESMRGPQISRLYLQVRPDEKIDDWPDDRIWHALGRRLGLGGGPSGAHGEIIERGMTAMRSVVTEPMRYGRLFLAGDAAHIVPPTGAKGLNLAVADVKVLADAVTALFHEGTTSLLDAYSATCLRRVWRVTQFSGWMTSLLHVSPSPTVADGEFDAELQLSQLRYIRDSEAASTSVAENYVGAPACTIACSTRRINAPLTDARSRASHVVTGTCGGTARASRTSSTECDNCPLNVLTATT